MVLEYRACNCTGACRPVEQGGRGHCSSWPADYKQRIAEESTDSALLQRRIDAAKELHPHILLPLYIRDLYPDHPGFCGTCWDDHAVRHQPWPCETMQALGVE